MHVFAVNGPARVDPRINMEHRFASCDIILNSSFQYILHLYLASSSIFDDIANDNSFKTKKYFVDPSLKLVSFRNTIQHDHTGTRLPTRSE